jgi:hypothetical protein
MQKTISYFQNEQGDYTITVDDQPVAFTKDESIAQLFQSLEYQIDNLTIWMTVWNDVDRYMRNHPEIELGESISKKVLSMLRERDAIVNILKIRK